MGRLAVARTADSRRSDAGARHCSGENRREISDLGEMVERRGIEWIHNWLFELAILQTNLRDTPFGTPPQHVAANGRRWTVRTCAFRWISCCSMRSKNAPRGVQGRFIRAWINPRIWRSWSRPSDRDRLTILDRPVCQRPRASRSEMGHCRLPQALYNRISAEIAS